MGSHDAEIYWMDEPEEHDYPAAENYLGLLLDEHAARKVVDLLRAAGVVSFRAKDLLRASQLALLDAENKHVARDLKKVADGERLSPVLLVRGQLSAVSGQRPLVVADGYHRICASYWLDENAEIPAKIVDLVASSR
jgi:hypothetical protein